MNYEYRIIVYPDSSTRVHKAFYDGDNLLGIAREPTYPEDLKGEEARRYVAAMYKKSLQLEDCEIVEGD